MATKTLFFFFKFTTRHFPNNSWYMSSWFHISFRWIIIKDIYRENDRLISLILFSTWDDEFPLELIEWYPSTAESEAMNYISLDLFLIIYIKSIIYQINIRPDKCRIWFQCREIAELRSVGWFLVRCYVDCRCDFPLRLISTCWTTTTAAVKLAGH